MNEKTYRRTKPGQRYVTSDPMTGRLVKLAADELGVITITTPEEQRVAAALGLPITKLPRASNDEVAALKSKKE